MTQNNKPATILPLDYEDSKCEDKNDFWFSDRLGYEVVRDKKQKEREYLKEWKRKRSSLREGVTN